MVVVGVMGGCPGTCQAATHPVAGHRGMGAGLGPDRTHGGPLCRPASKSTGLCRSSPIALPSHHMNGNMAPCAVS